MYDIPVQAVKALEILKKNNFQGYLVGGCVRDMILGRTPDDYDITTDALPKQIIHAFKNYKTIPTGLKHGTVTIIIDNFQIEITTFRKDGKYTDNRRPDFVEFTPSLKEDLVRRDFSMNAIAMDLNQNIIDLYDGIGDINKNIIRCIENPDRRFEEDSLRILRAMRFAAQLGFSIESRTAKSIHKNAYKLRNISAERINCELEKLLGGKNPYVILKEYEDIIKIFIPEYNYSDCILKKNTSSMLIKRAAFFMNLNNPHDIMKRLKYSNQDINNTCLLIKYFNTDVSTKSALKILLGDLGEKLVYTLLDFIDLSDLRDISNSRIMLDEILKNNECFLISQLDINGRDLINMGFSGAKIGEILNTLLDKVINEKLENKKNILAEYVRNDFMPD